MLCYVKAGHQKANTVWFHVYEVHTGVRFIEKESKFWLPRGERRENRELVRDGYRVALGEDQESSVHGGDGG